MPIIENAILLDKIAFGWHRLPSHVQIFKCQNRQGRPKMAEIVQLRDAFGVGREIPLNYVSRPEVDTKFVESLTRDKHVVIYGSSKQGKTTLRRHCLVDDDYIVVSCLNTMSLADLNGAILKAAGYRIEQTQTKTIGGAWKYGAEFAGEGRVPYIAKASGKATVGRSRQIQWMSSQSDWK